MGRAVLDHTGDADGVTNLDGADPVPARSDDGVLVDAVGPGEAVLALDRDRGRADGGDLAGLDRHGLEPVSVRLAHRELAVEPAETAEATEPEELAAEQAARAAAVAPAEEPAGTLDRRRAGSGRPDLGYYFAERYAGHARDAALFSVLAFYQCYRAFVRGKVLSFEAAEREVDATERERAAGVYGVHG